MFAGQGVHIPSLPVYPAIHVQFLMLSLEGGEELCGLHLTHWPPKRYDPASHSGGFTGVDVGNAIQGDELSGTGVEVDEEVGAEVLAGVRMEDVVELVVMVVVELMKEVELDRAVVVA